MRLFCIPFAGVGPSAFRGWAQTLGSDIETLYALLPGREGRLRETPLTSVSAIAKLLADTMEPWVDRPFGLFGHSLGGLVAFELARELRQRSLPAPSVLFVSATRTPQRAAEQPPLHHLDDLALLHAVNARYQGTVPPAVLGSRELIELLTPALRADLMALETYDYVDAPRLDCAISVFGGSQDRTVSADALTGWAAHTTQHFRLRVIDAGHLYLQTALAGIIGAIREDLTASNGAAPHAAIGSVV
jgi:medium-chain acyl-[acyl-carrier-protein] hydrolase